MAEKEARPLQSSASDRVTQERTLPGWIKVGAIAAASALAGGVAAAFFYRKTIARLREAESEAENPESGISDSETDDDL